MNNRDLLEFAKYFSAGAQKGVDEYQKGQANQIAVERNKIAAQDKAARDARENRRLDIYGRSVDNQGVLAAARAKAALAKIGGAGKPSGDDSALYEKYGKMGLTVAPGAGGGGGNTTNIYNQGSDGADPPIPPVPAGEAPVQYDAQGGMIRKFADGGISGDMSLQTAEQGGPGSRKGTSGLSQASNMFGNSFKLASGSLNPNRYKTATPDVRPVGPTGTGPAGSYTTADAQPGGALLPPGSYRRGGAVRRHANGGPVIDTGTSGPGSGFGVPAAPPVGYRRGI